MTVDELRRLLAAPELIVVDVVDSALDALRRALVVEHPSADDPRAAQDDSPVRRRARRALRIAGRLRRALALYRRSVDHALCDPPDDDIPF
jgi:hypothetical protein